MAVYLAGPRTDVERRRQGGERRRDILGLHGLRRGNDLRTQGLLGRRVQGEQGRVGCGAMPLAFFRARMPDLFWLLVRLLQSLAVSRERRLSCGFAVVPHVDMQSYYSYVSGEGQGREEQRSLRFFWRHVSRREGLLRRFSKSLKAERRQKHRCARFFTSDRVSFFRTALPQVYIGPGQYFVTSDIGRGRMQWYSFLALPPGSKSREDNIKYLKDVRISSTECFFSLKKVYFL